MQSKSGEAHAIPPPTPPPFIMPLAPPLALLVPPLRPPPGPPPATVAVPAAVPPPPEAPRVVPAKLLGFTQFSYKVYELNLHLELHAKILRYSAASQPSFSKSTSVVFAKRTGVESTEILRDNRIHLLNDRSHGSQDKDGARSKVAKVETSRVGTVFQKYLIFYIIYPYHTNTLTWIWV